MIPTWMYEQEDQLDEKSNKSISKKYSNSGAENLKSNSIEENQREYHHNPNTIAAPSKLFGMSGQNSMDDLNGREDPQSTNPSTIMDARIKNRALQNMLGRLQRDEPVQPNQNQNHFSQQKYPEPCGQSSPLSLKGNFNSPSFEAQNTWREPPQPNTNDINNARFSPPSKNKSFNSLQSRSTDNYTMQDRYAGNRPQVSNQTFGMNSEMQDRYIKPITNSLNYKMLQDFGRNQASTNNIEPSQTPSKNNSYQSYPVNSISPLFGVEKRQNTPGFVPYHHPDKNVEFSHDNQLGIRKNPQMPPPPKLPPMNGQVVHSNAVNPQHIGRRAPGMSFAAQNVSNALNAQPLFRQPAFTQSQGVVNQGFGSNISPQTNGPIIREVIQNRGIDKNIGELPNRLQSDYFKQSQAGMGNQPPGFQNSYSNPIAQGNTFQAKPPSQSNPYNTSNYPYPEAREPEHHEVDVEVNPQIRNSEMIEKLQAISQCEPVKKDILKILMDGQIHPGFEILRAIKKTRYMGSVAFGVIVYNMIETFGCDMILKEEQQGVDFYRINKRFKDLCSITFSDVDDDEEDEE